MVPTRRRSLLAFAGAAASGLAGCLDGGTAASPSDRSPADGTTAGRTCSARRPPHPDTGPGLPGPRSYPAGPPAFTADAVRQFLQEYERAYGYNELLADLAVDGGCVRYLELYVVDDETTVTEADGGFAGEVTTRGSYTGEPCPDATGTDTPSPPPHVDLPWTAVEYRLTERSLERQGTTVECW